MAVDPTDPDTFESEDAGDADRRRGARGGRRRAAHGHRPGARTTR